MFEITWHKIWCIMNESYGKKIYISGNSSFTEKIIIKLRCMDCKIEGFLELDSVHGSEEKKYDLPIIEDINVKNKDAYYIFTDMEEDRIKERICKLREYQLVMFCDYRFIKDFDLSTYIVDILKEELHQSNFSAGLIHNSNTLGNGSMYVISHKKCKIPEDGFYKGLQVGSFLNGKISGFYHDDGGISEKNKSYCELTGYYWLWKHCKSDFLGICHYRRFFVDVGGNIITEKEVRDYLQKYDIILPNPMKFKSINKHYLPEDLNIITQYQQAHYINDLQMALTYVLNNDSNYQKTIEEVMASKRCYGYNMMITRKGIFDQYCEWLFPILFYVEKNRSITYPDLYQERVFGFLAERLLNIWIEFNDLKCKELVVRQGEYRKQEE